MKNKVKEGRVQTKGVDEVEGADVSDCVFFQKDPCALYDGQLVTWSPR